MGRLTENNDSLKPKEPRLTIIAFLECEFRGLWKDEITNNILNAYAGKSSDREFNPKNSETYVALQEGCEVWLVRLDGTRKAFEFKKNLHVWVSGNTFKFNQGGVVDEISVVERQ